MAGRALGAIGLAGWYEGTDAAAGPDAVAATGGTTGPGAAAGVGGGDVGGGSAGAGRVLRLAAGAEHAR